MDSLNPTFSRGRSLRDLLDERCIEPNLQATEKPVVLGNLLELLVRAGQLEDSQPALEALLERERASSTAIGRGVAVPHAEVNGVTGPVLALGISPTPLVFNPLDREPVHLVFLLLFPHGATGLRMHLVGQVMRLMRKPELREALRRAASAAEAKRILLGFLPAPPPRAEGHGSAGAG